MVLYLPSTIPPLTNYFILTQSLKSHQIISSIFTPKIFSSIELGFQALPFNFQLSWSIFIQGVWVFIHEYLSSIEPNKFLVSPTNFKYDFFWVFLILITIAWIMIYIMIIILIMYELLITWFQGFWCEFSYMLFKVYEINYGFSLLCFSWCYFTWLCMNSFQLHDFKLINFELILLP